MPRRLTVRPSRSAAIAVSRHAVRAQRLVYIACANRALRYKHGRSRIVYIGTTKAGVRRIAASAAQKAETLLHHRGVRALAFYVVTCASRPRVRTWLKLERALILAFREQFGEVPAGNKHGRSAFWTDEAWYFSIRRLRAVIRQYS